MPGVLGQKEDVVSVTNCTKGLTEICSRTNNSQQVISSLDDLKVIRVTSLAQFLDCPRRWQAQITGQEPWRDSKWAQIGTAVHLMVEAYLRGEFELFEKSAEAWWARMFEAGVPDKERRALLKYLQSLSGRRCQVIALEHEFTLSVVEGAWPLRGHIDALFLDEFGVLIWDHKTNRRPETANNWSRRVQQRAYAWAVRRLLPEQKEINWCIGYVNLGEIVMWKTSHLEDLWFEHQFREAWEQFQQFRNADHWPEQLNDNCGYCPFQGQCATYRTSIEAMLPPMEHVIVGA